MIKVGIIGGAGYTAGELIRILLNHPEVELAFVNSESNAGNHLYDVHQGIFGDTEMLFSSAYDLNSIDVLFLCGGHGKSQAFWDVNPLPDTLKVIDLAQDYRDESDGYVYGLPEWQIGKIAGARKIANPGCFATCIQLALLPLAAKGLLSGDINVTAITGSTGAGVKPGATTHFSWRNNNVSTYKVFEHQHLLEINRNLASLQRAAVPVAAVEERATLGNVRGGTVSEENGGAEQSEASETAAVGTAAACNVNFVPMRGDFARGIFASVVLDCTLDEVEANELYRNYYNGAAFTFVSGKPVDLKDVVNTNKALVHVEKHGGKLVVSSVIDNLLKGASGQAVQNMNIIFGLPETEGLKLKASAF